MASLSPSRLTITSVYFNFNRQATKLALLLRARADFTLFLENFKRGRVGARARVIDLHYSLSYVHVCAILSKDPSSGG